MVRHASRAVMAGVTAVACAVALAACSSSASTPTSPSASTDTAGTSIAPSTGSSAATGDPTALSTWVPTSAGKATGTPYTVGLIEDNYPGSSSILQYVAGAKAAISYVNDELGGIKGHPLKLYECNTGALGQTAPTAACAQKVAAQHPIMVLGVALAYGLAGEQIMTAHQIPTAMLPAQPPDFANPENFPPGGGGLVEWQAQGAYAAQQLHAKTASTLQQTSPLAATVKAQIKIGLGSGVKVNNVVAPGFAIDLPSIVKAVQSKPDALIPGGISAGPAGVQSLKQIGAQGFPSDHIILNMSGADGPTLQQAGSALSGAVFSFEVVPWTVSSDPQVATYLKEYANYGTAGATDQSGFTEVGFATVIELWTAANKVSGDVTAPSLLSYLKTASVPGFLSHGLGAKPSPGYPGIRNPYIFMVKAQNGSLVPVSGKWFAPPALLPKS